MTYIVISFLSTRLVLRVTSKNTTISEKITIYARVFFSLECRKKVTVAYLLGFGHGLTSRNNNDKPFFLLQFFMLLSFVVQLKKVKTFEEKKRVAQEKNIKIESILCGSFFSQSYYTAPFLHEFIDFHFLNVHKEIEK